ncbi:MAG: hypothetical protein C0176_00235 [Mesoaciditoga sp.]|uniref:hypothetical protein n=1 Tax=Athalassotoga sp. TaxID=2022597 RepID=UPI000CC136CB|nr:MAG: hypothetical protein C0185_02195 [Mesoaciditoga sp.]PMP80953.1 MAG: hypothetical protein C0176_00235 [Mesoaciditoga sp.]
MADYFFSYGKKEPKDQARIEDLVHELTRLIATEIVNEIRNQIKVFDKKNKDSNDLKKILEEEISKFDSIEEVKYLGEYLVDLWRKTHEF